MAVQNSHHPKTTGVFTDCIVIMPGSKIVTLLAAQRGGRGFPFHLSMEAWAVLELDRGGLSSLTCPQCIPRSYRRAIEVRVLCRWASVERSLYHFRPGVSGGVSLNHLEDVVVNGREHFCIQTYVVSLAGGPGKLALG